MVNAPKKEAAIKDPALQRLKEEKHQWQMLVKLIIAKLQAYKRGIGGKGDSKTHLPAVKINEAFPPEYTIYLDSIADDYVSLINGAKKILELQSNLAEEKPKSKKEKLKDIAISASQAPAELASEASWAGSRMWARISLMKLSKKERKLRIKVINAAKDSIKDLRQIEDFLLSKSEDATADSVKAFLRFAQLFNQIVISSAAEFATFEKTHDLLMEPAEEGEQPNEPINVGEEVVFQASPPEAIDIATIALKLESIGSKLSQISDKTQPTDYKILLGLFSGIQNDMVDLDKYDHDEVKSISDRIDDLENRLNKSISEIENKLSFLIDDDIHKLADNILSRWVKRKMMSVNPDREGYIKLDIIEQMHSLDDELNKLMDLLENVKSSASEIISQILTITKFLIKIANKFMFLGQSYYDHSQKPQIRKHHLIALKNILKDIRDATG